MSELENPERLGALSDLVLKMRELEGEIKACNAVIKEFKKEHERLSEQLIPEMMVELGIAGLELTDGKKLTIDKAYFAKIPDDKKSEAFNWLADNGYEALIKTDITTSFGKGEGDKVTSLKQTLVEGQYSFEAKDNVHPQTLKALVRERLEEGNDMPDELFGVYVKNITKIK